MSVFAPEDLTEKQWSSQVYDLCRLLQWRRYHTYFSKRSPGGYPDETLVRDRIIFLELKTETGKLSSLQREWLTAILNAGGEAYVARPRDFNELVHVLRERDLDPRSNLLAVRTRQELELSAPP